MGIGGVTGREQKDGLEVGGSIVQTEKGALLQEAGEEELGETLRASKQGAPRGLGTGQRKR